MAPSELSVPLHNTVVASSKAKLLWPSYTLSKKFISFFLLFSLIYFIPTLLRYNVNTQASQAPGGRREYSFIKVTGVLVIPFRGLKVWIGTA